jgi:hypothetical protein
VYNPASSGGDAEVDYDCVESNVMKDGKNGLEEVNDNSSLTDSDGNGIGYSGGVMNLISGCNNASGGSEDKGSHEVAEIIRWHAPSRCRGSRLAGFRRVNKVVVVRIVGSIGTCNGDIDNNEADANDGDAEETVKSIDISSGCSGGAGLLPQGKGVSYEAELAQYQNDHDNLQWQEHKTKDDVDNPASRGGNDDKISYLRMMSVRWKLVMIIITPTIA